MILELAREFAPSCAQTYNKYYIGFSVNGRPCNFALCRPQKSGMRLEITVPQDEEIDSRLEEAGIDVLDYEKRSGRYRLKLDGADIQEHADMLKDLLRQGYHRRV